MIAFFFKCAPAAVQNVISLVYMSQRSCNMVIIVQWEKNKEEEEGGEDFFPLGLEVHFNETQCHV